MRTITLTDIEYRALKEAVRLAQELNEENFDKLDATLSRVQRKLGQQPTS